ncbi:hypothetical protein FACS1894158_17960 [Betaproteobacteria bacterium]|nr:hypothetical protein FACS1894158_17960 [Betaproteobacteria bacterium]
MIMTSAVQTSFAEHMGRTLGRMWKAALRLERKADDYLVAQGMNANLARGMLWAVKLALLALLLYGAFWVALLLGFAFFGAWAIRHTDWEAENDEPEWKYDHLGFGLYNPDGLRIDSGDHEPD